MFTGTLALVKRSLRVGSRSIMPHLLHFGLLALTFMTLHTTAMGSSLGAPGLRLFGSMVYLNLFFIMLAGCGLFASAITEEKEEATLSLLQMAGINPLTLLLGKMVPRLFTALLLLAIQIPMIVLAITLGGVTPKQVFAAYVSLAAFVVLIAGIALLASVLCRKTRTASILTGLTILFVLFAPWVLMTMVKELQRDGWTLAGLEWLLLTCQQANVFSRLTEILMSTFSATSDSSVWCLQVISSVLAGIGAFLFSWLVFPLCATDEKQSGAGVGSSIRRKFVAFRPGRAWSMALTWKDFHFNTGGYLGIVLRLIAYPAIVLFLFMILSFGRGNLFSGVSREELGGTLMISSIIFGVLELTNISGRLFRDEVRRKTWPSLVMLPNKYVSHVIWPKLGGYLLALIPAGLYFGLGAVTAPFEFGEAVNDMFSRFDSVMAFCAVCIQFFFFLHLAAYLSLFIKWGAVPLSFGITYILLFFCIATFGLIASGGPDEGRVMVFFLILIGIVAIVSLQMAIADRLRNLGST